MGTELAKANNELAIRPPVEIIEKLVLTGDMKDLRPHERLAYYNWRCQSIGVDPASHPFEYLELDGKTVLYPKAYLADQLRNKRGISVRMGAGKLEHGIYTIVATASDADGRVAENVGAVPCVYSGQIKEWYDAPGGRRQSRWVDNPRVGQQYTGVELANAIKKATTQAQRRATFSLVGLGGQDTDDMEGVQRLDVNAMHDPKGLLPTDNAEPAPTVVVAEVPVNWSDPDQWPAGQPETINCKMVEPVVKKASNGADYATVTIDDGFGVSKFGTFHASGIAAIRACVGKLCEAQVIATGKAFGKLLTLKEVVK